MENSRGGSWGGGCQAEVPVPGISRVTGHLFICRGVVWAAAPRSQGEASSYRQTGVQLLWDSCSSLGAGALLPLVLPGDGKGRGRTRAGLPGRLPWSLRRERRKEGAF